MSHHETYKEDDFSFKKLFVPLTTLKATHWIIVVGLVIFFNSIFNGFVNDDLYQIPQQSVDIFKNLFSFFSGGTFYNGSQLTGVYYRPLSSIYFAFMHNVFGLNPAPYHILQIFIHISNSIILYFIFNKFFKKTIAFFISLIFLVHPLNSENVFYISSSQETISFLFGALAVWMIINFSTKKTLFLIIPFLLFSIFSKESGMLFVFVAIVCSFVFYRKHFFPILTSSIGVLLFYLIFRILRFGFFSPHNAPITQLSLTERLINIPEIFSFYLQTFIFPLNLSSSYQWAYKTITPQHFIIPLIINIFFITIISYFAHLLYKKKDQLLFKVYLFFMLWFAVGMIIHLQIIPLDSTLAERWFYFPMVGILGMLGVFFNKYYRNFNNKYVLLAIIILVSLLSLRTYVRSFNWSDDFTLALQDIKVSTDAYDLENKIATGYLIKGNLKEAKLHAERSISLYPLFSNYNNLGTVYLAMNDYSKARKSFLTALSYGDYFQIYGNFCFLALKDGAKSEDMKYVDIALKKFPFNSKLLNCYAIIEYKRGNIKIAREAITKAYAYNKNHETMKYYDIIMNKKPL